METKLPEHIERPGQNAPLPGPNGSWKDHESRLATAGPDRSVSIRKRYYWIGVNVLLLGGLAYLVMRAVPSHPATEREVVNPAAFVSVATVRRETVADTVRFPAEFRPYEEDELRVKVSGYLTNITVDFGDRVKAGQLLAELEVPELQNELEHAKAAEVRAEADHFKAHQAYDRLHRVQRDNPKVTLVPQQDVDSADSEDRATEAAIDAAKAEVRKDETLMAYTKIFAPYDGVITRRYADPGALIQAGTSSDTQSMPIVKISDNYRLRLDFPVSLLWVRDVKEGQPVEVEVDSLGGKKFPGKIRRFTREVDADTRKMWTEVEVPNPKLEIVPGMYAVVLLHVNQHTNALTIPVQAVSSERHPSVYVVNAKDEIEERPVTLGIETPYRWEVLSGLQEGDRVIVGSRSMLKLGEKVQPKPWNEELAAQ